MAAKPRARFSKEEEVRRILSELTQEQLTDRAACAAAVAHLKVIPQVWGKTRRSLINGDNSNDPIDVTLKAIKNCGGIAALKRALSTIEKCSKAAAL